MRCQFLKMVSACGMRLDKILDIPFQVKIFVQLIRIIEIWCCRRTKKKVGTITREIKKHYIKSM